MVKAVKFEHMPGGNLQVPHTGYIVKFQLHGYMQS